MLGVRAAHTTRRSGERCALSSFMDHGDDVRNDLGPHQLMEQGPTWSANGWDESGGCCGSCSALSSIMGSPPSSSSSSPVSVSMKLSVESTSMAAAPPL